MKSFWCYLIIIVIIFYLYSCTTITQKIYLQSAEFTGPINQPPIHITDSVKNITISPRISLNSQEKLTNNPSFQHVDTIGPSYAATSKNIKWNLPKFTAAVDFDFEVSQNFALSFGISYSEYNNSKIMGGMMGLGLWSAIQNVATRIEAGFIFQSIIFEAYTVTTLDQRGPFNYSEHDIWLSHYNSSSTYMNPFISFTLNTFNKNWLFNIYIRAGYSWQKLFDPETGSSNSTTTIIDNAETTAGILHLTPGIYFNLGDSVRLLLGARVLYTQSIEDVLITNPMAQFDFSL